MAATGGRLDCRSGRRFRDAYSGWSTSRSPWSHIV